jgi:hypothetical protein
MLGRIDLKVKIKCLYSLTESRTESRTDQQASPGNVCSFIPR